jgi:hypothetical protein
VAEPLFLEVEDNPNCEGIPQLIYSTLGEPRPVTHVMAARRGINTQMHRVTGWSSESGGSPCPAFAVRVEDSGAGSSLLVYGGDWGLRLLPPGPEEPWGLHSAHQWGEPYLVLGDESEVRFA